MSYICIEIDKLMNIIFEDKALEELYTDGSTKSHQYHKLSKDVIKQYIKVVNFLKAARRLEDLFYIFNEIFYQIPIKHFWDSVVIPHRILIF